jgi:hypothetical protein
MSELLDRHGGVATRADLLAVLPVHVVDHAIASGALVLVLPRTYTTPEQACDSEIHRRAALRYAGPEAALSHPSGLAAWGMSVPEGNAVHISVDRSCRLRHAVGLVGPSTRLRLAAASSRKTPAPGTARNPHGLPGRRL